MMVEMCVLMVEGDSFARADDNVCSNWLRGTKPTFIRRQATKPVDSNGNPTTHEQRELTNLRNKPNNMKNK